jgi:uncharacterized protein YigA (DUF484 family)
LTPAARRKEAGEAASVEAYLRANPGFLAARPGLYAVLAPPRRVHGEVLADHMAAMIQAGRAEWRQVLAAGRTRGAFAARVAEAVVALIAAPDARDCVRHEWPALLGVEHATLWPRAAKARMALGDVTRADPALHGEAAPLVRREALLRVGTETLTLGARAAEDIPHEPESLDFLARALLAALVRPPPK